MTPNVAFMEIDLESANWDTPEGYPDSIRQVILVDTLDAVSRTGVRMLVMRFDAGARTDAAITHDEAEDVFVFSGELIVGRRAGGAFCQIQRSGVCMPARRGAPWSVCV